MGWPTPITARTSAELPWTHSVPRLGTSRADFSASVAALMPYTEDYTRTHYLLAYISRDMASVANRLVLAARRRPFCISGGRTDDVIR